MTKNSSFTLTHASVTIWHPSTDKGSVGSSTIHQGTPRVMATHVADNRHRDLCPSPVPAMVAHEPSPGPFSHGLGVPGKFCLRQLPMDKELFLKFRFPVEKSQHATEGKNANLNALEGEIRGTIWFYLHHPFLKQPSSGSRDTVSSWPVICPTGEESVWVDTWLPYMQDATKKAHFSLTPSRVIDSRTMWLEGRKRVEEQHIGILENIKRM